MYLIDFGDAMVETKQLGPGTKPDSLYVWGRISGSPEDDVDIAWLMLASESEPE
jgi:hypothetical protein